MATRFHAGPCRAVGPAMACAISVEERVENQFIGAVQGEILGDLDLLGPVLTHAEPSFRVSEAERVQSSKPCFAISR